MMQALRICLKVASALIYNFSMNENLKKLLGAIDQRLQNPATPPAEQEKLREALQKHFGYAEFKPQQQAIIAAILARHSLLAVLPTGHGKSLCYQLPALMQAGLTIVVSPLISLMKDQIDQLRQRGIAPVAFINSSLALNEQRREMARTKNGGVKLLYVAPERFRSRAFTEELARLRLSLFVIDEAHCVSQWGHDFRPSYLALKETLRLLQPPAIALFTATATPEVEADILLQLGLHHVEKFIGSVARANLYFRVQRVNSEADKFRAIAAVAEKFSGKGIIYVSRKREAEEVAAFLKSLGFAADFYHAGRSDDDRRQVQERFFDDGAKGLRVVAATNAFGLGIDKRDIRFVIHFALPGSLEAYYQEAGRAGRDDLPANCVLLYWHEDRGLQEWFIKESLLSKTDLSKLLRAVEATPAVAKFHWLAPADLEWQTGLDKTKLTVGLSHLQRLGFIRQHPNICREVKITKHGNGASDSAPFKNIEGAINTREFCQTHRLSPAEWMAELYDAQWRGELHFYGVEDCWLAECLRPSTELAAITETQLGMHDLERQKQRRLEQMLLYAITPDCRELVIRRYFGETAAEKDRCGRCDNCEPTRQTTLSSPNQQTAVDEYLQRRETPELAGPDLDGGIALAFHTFIQNGEHVHTEVGDRVHAFKYRGEKAQAEWLLERALKILAGHPSFKEIDAVGFVPSTEASRPYLPVPLFAENLRQRLGVQAVGQLRKTRATRPQKEMVTMEQKRRNVAGAFAVNEPGAKGQRILLIDDIYDSGATINECARVLKAAGATKVYALTLTKTGHVAK